MNRGDGTLPLRIDTLQKRIFGQLSSTWVSKERNLVLLVQLAIPGLVRHFPPWWVTLKAITGEPTLDYRIVWLVMNWDGFPYPTYRPTGVMLGSKVNVDNVIAIIQYILLNGFAKFLNKGEHPLLIAVPPYWNEIEVVDLRRVIFNKLKTPYICFMHSSVLTLMSVGKTSGCVVLVGYQGTYVVPVWEGKPVEGAMRSLVGSKGFKKNEEFIEELFKETDSNPPLIVQKTCEAIMSCSEEMHNTLSRSIFLSGGGVLLPDFEERFRKGLIMSSYNLDFNVEVSSDPTMDVVKGGKVVMSLSNARLHFSDMREEVSSEIVRTLTPSSNNNTESKKSSNDKKPSWFSRFFSKS